MTSIGHHAAAGRLQRAPEARHAGLQLTSVSASPPEKSGGRAGPVIMPGVKHAETVAAAYPGCQWLYPFPGAAAME